MIQTATMPLCHISRWRSGMFLRMPQLNMTFWRCGILISKAVEGNRLTVQKLGNQYDRLSAGWAQRFKKNTSPHPPVVACCLRLGQCGQMRPRVTRGLLIRLLETTRNQISESFQVVRIRDSLQTLIWVPCGWVYSSARVSVASFCHLSYHMNGHAALALIDGNLPSKFWVLLGRIIALCLRDSGISFAPIPFCGSVA